MSLHLIESHAPARVMVLRRPGANVVSIVMHAVLITMAIIATASPPTFAHERPSEHTLPLFVPPAVSPPTPASSVRAAPSNSAATPSSQPPLIAPIIIPTNIPPIPDISSTPALDPQAITIVRRAGGDGPGVANGTPYGTGNGDDVRDQLHVDRPVMLLPGMPLPRYPEMLRSAGITDTLVANFVVDTLGRVEPGSLVFSGSPHPAFAASVRESLLKARFHAAEAGGSKVRQLVQQPFVFSLAR